MKEIYQKLSSSFKWISLLMVLILSLSILQVIILLFSTDYNLIKILTLLSASVVFISVLLIVNNFWSVSEEFMNLSKFHEDPNLNLMNKDGSSDLKIDDVNDPEVLNELINRMNQKK